ncbi:MAG: hypothetical protein RL414_22, partial [Actinomycetota bacterium]
MKTITYWGYATAWFLVRYMPEKWAYGLASRAADYIYKRNGKQIQRLRSNYSRVHPDFR